jgi:ribosomal protein S18 acetylase RimI-like enzyme
LNYRAARKSDVEQIALLHADSWKRTYRGMLRDEFLDGDVAADRLDVWTQRLGAERADQFVFIAEDQGRVCGFICAYGNEDSAWGSLIDNLHVAHDQRRRGIGTLLMRQVGAWLMSNYGGCGVYLWVMEANHAARRFYEALGATNTGTVEKKNPGGGSASNCRYRWPRPESLVNPG